MKLLFKILFFLLAWTNNLSATPVFTKVVLPTYELAFSKTETVTKESIAGAFTKTFKHGIKSFKVFNNTTNAVFDVIEAAKNTHSALYGQLSAIKAVGLRIGGEATDAMYLMYKSSAHKLAKVSKYGLSQVRYFTGSTYDVVHNFGSIPVKNGTSYVLQEVQMVKYGNEVGMVVSGAGNALRRIDDFIPSSGTQLTGNTNKTTTLLGRWIPDMQVVKGKMLPNEFNVGTEFGTEASNIGGFNFLNIPDNLANASSDFFNQYNKPWLQQAIQRGDDIVLATPPINQSDFITATGQLKGMYAEELKFLVQQNYKPINLSATEWNIIKTWFP